MRNIERRMLVVTRAAAALGVLFLLIVAGLTVVDIMVRAASGRPIHGADDLSHMLTIIIVAACFPAGLLERRQIKVTFLGVSTVLLDDGEPRDRQPTPEPSSTTTPDKTASSRGVCGTRTRRLRPDTQGEGAV